MNGCKIENEIKVLKDRKCDVDKIEKKYGKCLRDCKILQKLELKFKSDRHDIYKNKQGH